jgi:hypothetical protein
MDINAAVGGKAGLSREKIEAALGIKAATDLPERERIALEYADRVSATPVDVPDDFFAMLRRLFSEKEIVELTGHIAHENYSSKSNRRHAARPTTSATLRLHGSHRRPNVLIDAEQVHGIVLVLNRRQPLVVVSERCLNPFLALVHHEIDVCPTSRIRMQRVEIVLAPRRDLWTIRRIRIDTDNHFRPIRVAIAESGVIPTNPMRCAIDRVEMHG